MAEDSKEWGWLRFHLVFGNQWLLALADLRPSSVTFSVTELRVEPKMNVGIFDMCFDITS